MMDLNLMAEWLATSSLNSRQRKQLEAHAVSAGLSIVEARRTIDSAFHAAEPRSLPS